MRILVADDHALFRDGIISLLKAASFEVVGQVGDGQTAVEAAQRLRPDVVLMDIDLPQMSGLEALRRIKAAHPEIQVVMLTVSEDDANLFEAIKSGAQGYLLKSLNTERFFEMLDGLQYGKAAMARQTTAHLLKEFSQPSPQSEPYLVAGGLSNKAMAQKLLVSENTVKYHLKNIMQKLGVKNRTEAVTYAIRAGLLASGPPVEPF
jgi:DNA-binding NarL/FixJ family response regulator